MTTSLPFIILETPCPSCPSCPAHSAYSATGGDAAVATSYTSTFERLVFLSLGYGGWLGIALLPTIWTYPLRTGVRTVLSFLAPPLCAVTLTAIFSSLYSSSWLLYYIAGIMVHPSFIESCMGVVCISVSGVLFFVSNRMMLMNSLKEGMETDEEINVSDEELDSDNEVIDDEEDAEDTEDADEIPHDNWRATANFESLRNAPPLLVSPTRDCKCSDDPDHDCKCDYDVPIPPPGPAVRSIRESWWQGGEYTLTNNPELTETLVRRFEQRDDAYWEFKLIRRTDGTFERQTWFNGERRE